MHRHARLVIRPLVILPLLLAASPSPAQPAEPFFADKEIRLVVPADPGGGWGLSARLLSEHMRRYIAGDPAIVLQFMPGASGITAANHLYNVAPRDGTTIALLLKEVAITQKVRPEARYDANRFGWVGRIAPVRSVLFVWSGAPATTIEAIRTTEIIAGSLGKSDQSYTNPVALNFLAGTRIKAIGGYRGSADVLLGMERGEVHAWSGSWDGIKATRADYLAAKKLIPLVQFALSPAPDLPGVPVLTQFARNEEAQTMAEFLVGGSDVGLSISTPPGVPEARMRLLRDAFEKTVRDPAYIEAAGRASVSIEPATGDAVAEIVRKATQISPETLNRVNEIIK